MTGCSVLTDLDSLGAGGDVVVPLVDASVDAPAIEAGEALPTAIAITPAAVQIGESRNVRFETTTEATFTIEEGAGGRVDATGLYVAPPTSGTFTVVATSTKNPALVAKATVTVVPLKVEIVAGRYGGSGTADGRLQYAHFRTPSAIVPDLDGTHIYVSDPTTSTIRVIDREQKRVDTYAGKTGENLFVDGPNDVARLRSPRGLVEGDGGIFVFGDDCVRRIDKVTKAISTFAGSCGESDFVDGVGTAARLTVTSTAGRYGNVAVFCENNRLRTMDITSAQVKTIATLGDTCRTGPHTGATKAVFFDGSTLKAFDGASAATIATIATVPFPPTALCSSQNFVLVASSDRVIRLIDLTTKAVSVYAGQADASNRSVDGVVEDARFLDVQGMSCSYQSGFGGGFAGYLTDTTTVRSFSTRLFGDGVVTLNAPGIHPAIVDGNSDVGSFMKPVRVAVDSSRNVYVSDVQFLEAANVIRRIDGVTGDLTTFAGAKSIAPIIGPGTPAKDGTAETAVFNIPISIAVGEKDLYVADFIGAAVRRISLETRRVDTLAGTLGTMGFVNDVGIRAQFRFLSIGTTPSSVGT